MKEVKVEAVASFSGFEEVQINLESPVKFTCPIMELRQVNIITGANGSGKSFMMKLIWVGGLMLNIIIAKKLNTFIGKPNEEELQFLLDHTFEDHKMEGSVALHGKFGTETVILDFEVEKGKVVAVNFLIPKKMQLFKCTYQPSSTRLFSNLDMYIKLKKKLGMKGMPKTDADILSLLDMFKLYEFMAFEEVIQKLKHIGVIWTHIESIIKKFCEEDADGRTSKTDNLANIHTMEYDEDAAEVYYYHTDGSKRKVTTLSNGEQAIIMMFLAAC